MSINGLRFSQERHSSAPLETKSGSYIYAGDAANFHDWQFRTLLRIRLYEQQLEETSKSADPVGTTATEPAAEDSQEYATFPDLSGATQATQPTSAASTPKSGASRKSSKSGKQKTDVDRGPLVNKVIEGLRGDAFSIARDLGLEVLSEPGGLVKLVGEIRSHVFPRAREEAKELFVQDRNKVDLCLASQANPCFPMFRGDDVGGTCFASWMTQWCFQTA